MRPHSSHSAKAGIGYSKYSPEFVLPSTYYVYNLHSPYIICTPRVFIELAVLKWRRLTCQQSTNNVTLGIITCHQQSTGSFGCTS